MSRCQKTIAVMLLAVVAGCAKSGQQVAPVHGRITLDGQPLPNAEVQFQPENAQRVSMARTNAEGRYELMYRRGQPGAVVGPHSIRIWVSSEVVRNPPIIAKQFDTATELRREVEAGKNNEFDFDVTTEKK